ncbi:MAG: 1-deoxy-D-xylulose-5-phosphate reductoisomerase [Candidatus Caenarcaniphilales bacterium]|nr:1-deoxy-D-xylulose-5-phosphate reductoisomerase [Candidatus Caenarcaniphilales bacterium]
MPSLKKLAILGATGSIGQQTLDLVRKAPERFEVKSLSAAGNNLAVLAEICQEFAPQRVALSSEAKLQDFRTNFVGDSKLDYASGSAGLCELAVDPEIDVVVLGLVGFMGLEPCIAALRASKRVVIANKEPLVSAGGLIQRAIQEGKGELIPADSEQVALHQCLQGNDPKAVRRVYLTASGGPFWESSLDLTQVSVEQALQHPTWKMGRKISIDSATLMNKGLEVIEAHSLFGFDYDRIETLIHTQSLIHGLVEYLDGSILAQFATNDMRLALQYALDYPERKQNLSQNFLDLSKSLTLRFDPPDLERFPCLRLAYQAGRAGRSYPAVLNASNEVAVQAFLDGEIKFTDIAQTIEKALDDHDPKVVDTLDTVLQIDQESRSETISRIRQSQ